MRVPIATIALSVAVGLTGSLASSCSDGSSSAPSATDSASTFPRSSGGTNLPHLSKTFKSPLMGYTVDYPGGWTPTPATDLWLPNASNFWDDPVGDRLQSSAAGFRGTSQPLTKGEPTQQWMHDYLASEPTGCGTREQIRVDGHAATIGLNGCAGQGRLGGKVFDVILVSGNRGYNFTMEGEVNRDLLLAMLATVKLDPPSAKSPE